MATEKKPFKTLNGKSAKPEPRLRGGSPDAFDDLDDLDLSDDNPEFEMPIADGPPPPDAKPNPVALPAPINPEGGKQSVELHRNLFCIHYDGCLDEAVKAGWNSFTCLRCAFYHSGRKVEEGGVERFATQRRAT